MHISLNCLGDLSITVTIYLHFEVRLAAGGLAEGLIYRILTTKYYCRAGVLCRRY